MIRGALDSLCKGNLIATDGRMRRAVVHGIIDWGENHEPTAKNYFKLFRRLLDEKQRACLKTTICFGCGCIAWGRRTRFKTLKRWHPRERSFYILT
jgi:hypothetical protein